jgi:hypothetical protein
VNNFSFLVLQHICSELMVDERRKGRLRSSQETFHELCPTSESHTVDHYEDDELLGHDADSMADGGGQRRERARLPVAGGEDGVGNPHEKDFVSRWWVDLLFWVCGISVFARTEAFFAQTTLFVRIPQLVYLPTPILTKTKQLQLLVIG